MSTDKSCYYVCYFRFEKFTLFWHREVSSSFATLHMKMPEKIPSDITFCLYYFLFKGGGQRGQKVTVERKSDKGIFLSYKKKMSL